MLEVLKRDVKEGVDRKWNLRQTTNFFSYLHRLSSRHMHMSELYKQPFFYRAVRVESSPMALCGI